MVSGIGDVGFELPFGWRSGHLQTVRSRIRRRTFEFARLGPQRELLVPMDDGSGDQLKVKLHTSRYHPAPDVGGGLVLLVHGLGGSMESSYVQATTVGLLGAGYNVARVDLRGVGESAATCSLLYHAGRSEDLRAVLAALSREPEARDNNLGVERVAIMGFSLGGTMTLKLMSEASSLDALFAGIAVSAPLDLVAGSIYLRRAGLGLYEKVLLAGLKRQALEVGEDGRHRLSSTERAGVRRARTLAAFDDVLTAPRNGWRDSAEYYAVNSPNQFLPMINVPTMVIHALDDPMIPSLPYRAVDWAALEDTGFIFPRITKSGGHVGFHQRGVEMPWFVGEALSFLGSN